MAAFLAFWPFPKARIAVKPSELLRIAYELPPELPNSSGGETEIMGAAGKLMIEEKRRRAPAPDPQQLPKEATETFFFALRLFFFQRNHEVKQGAGAIPDKRRSSRGGARGLTMAALPKPSFRKRAFLVGVALVGGARRRRRRPRRLGFEPTATTVGPRSTPRGSERRRRLRRRCRRRRRDRHRRRRRRRRQRRQRRRRLLSRPCNTYFSAFIAFRSHICPRSLKLEQAQHATESQW